MKWEVTRGGVRESAAHVRVLVGGIVVGSPCRPALALKPVEFLAGGAASARPGPRYIRSPVSGPALGKGKTGF